MDIVFMGTPEFAVASLKALHTSTHTIKGVVTMPDKPAGRGRKLQQSAVKDFAIAHQLPVLQPTNLKDEGFLKQLEDLKPQLIVVVAFRMLPKVVWSMPPFGTINLHGSLLPNYRGAAPINWAVINGETKTGATTFFINEDIDTGAMLQQTEIDILEKDTAGDVHDRLMEAGAHLLVETVTLVEAKKLTPKPQQLNGTERAAPKIFKEDLHIDVQQSMHHIYNKIRGLSPFPTAQATFINGETEQNIKLILATKTDETPTMPAGSLQQEGKKTLWLHTKNGVLSLTEVQLQGKKRMQIADFLNGIKIESNARLI